MRRRKVVQDWLGKRKRGGSGAVRKRLCAELSREAESSTVKLMCGRNVGGVSRSGAEAEKDPREVMKPVSSSTAGMESGFEATVESFHEAISLRVIGCGGLMSDIEVGTKGGPKGRCELGAPVWGDGIRDSKTRDPVLH